MTFARTLRFRPALLLLLGGLLVQWPQAAQAQPDAVTEFRAFIQRGVVTSNVPLDDADSSNNGGGDTSLPYSFRDDQNNDWQIRQDGTVGRSDLFPNDGYGKLYTNLGAFPDNGQARWNGARNQMVVGPSSLHGVTVTRYLSFDKKKGYCRYVDLFENAGAKDVKFESAELYFKVAGGWHVRKNIGENAETGEFTSLMVGSNSVFTGLVFASHGSSHQPKVDWDKLGVCFKFSIVVPAHGAVALMHVQVRRSSADDVVAFLSKASDADFLKNLPAKAVGHILNFDVTAKSAAGHFVTHVGKYDLSRDDKLDLIELRNGDHCKGTITDASYRMQTSYGNFELPAKDVAGIISLSPSGTRQLLVTVDRQALAGRLDKTSLGVELPGQGANAAPQVISVPLTDIAQVGYRPRPHEGETAAKGPQVFLLGGDVLAIDPPRGQVTMVTRFGAISIPFDRIATILFDDETSGLHQVQLVDGSHFGALIETSQLPLHLRLSPVVSAGQTKGSDVRFGPGSISRLVLSASNDKTDKLSVLTLVNDDQLVGTMQGRIALDTALETMDLELDKIVQLARIGEGNETALRVTFTDGATFTGQLHDALIPFVLASGAVLQIPVDQFREFSRPRPGAATVPATAPATAPTTARAH